MMKLTKSQLVEIIKEELDDESNSALVLVLSKLLGKLDKLDVSIDYLSAAVTDEGPLDIGLAQQMYGRAIGPRGQRRTLEENEEGEMAYGGRGRYMHKEELEEYLESIKNWEALRHAVDQSTFQGIGKVEDIPKGAAEMLGTYLAGLGGARAIAPHLSKLKAWQKLPGFLRLRPTITKQPFKLAHKPSMPAPLPNAVAALAQETGESEYEGPKAIIAGGDLEGPYWNED
jgi:hypothetical protein